MVKSIKLLTGFNRQHLISPNPLSIDFCFRIDFRILLVTFNTHLGLIPGYTADMLTLYEPVCSFGSSGVRLESKGHRAFAIRAPRLWNDLPEVIRLAVTSFKSFLKFFSFIPSFT